MIRPPPPRGPGAPPPPPPPSSMASLGVPSPPTHHVRFQPSPEISQSELEVGKVNPIRPPEPPGARETSNVVKDNPLDLSAGLGIKPRRMSRPAPPAMPSTPPPVPPPPPPPPHMTGSLDEALASVGKDMPHVTTEEQTGSLTAADMWNSLEDEKRQYFQFFQLTEAIKTGALMKVKTGAAGNNPATDNFTRFKSTKKWMVVCWGIDSLPNEDWCIALFDEEVKQAITLDHILKHASKIVPLTEVSDVYIDPKKTSSFRVYRGMEATQCSPLTANSPPASAWADAIFALMQLQSFSEKDLLSMRYKEFQQFYAKLKTLEVANSPAKVPQAGEVVKVPTTDKPPTEQSDRSKSPNRRASIMQAVKSVFSFSSPKKDRPSSPTSDAGDPVAPRAVSPPRAASPPPARNVTAQVESKSKTPARPFSVPDPVEEPPEVDDAKEISGAAASSNAGPGHQGVVEHKEEVAVISSPLTKLREARKLAAENAAAVASPSSAPSKDSTFQPIEPDLTSPAVSLTRDQSQSKMSDMYKASVAPTGSTVISPLLSNIFRTDSAGYGSSDGEQKKSGGVKSDSEGGVADKDRANRFLMKKAQQIKEKMKEESNISERLPVPEMTDGEGVTSGDNVTSNPLKRGARAVQKKAVEDIPAKSSAVKGNPDVPVPAISKEAVDGVRSPESELGRATVLDQLFRLQFSPARSMAYDSCEEELYSNAEALKALYDSKILEDGDREEFKKKHLKKGKGYGNKVARKKWLKSEAMPIAGGTSNYESENSDHNHIDDATTNAMSPKFVAKFRRHVDTMKAVNGQESDSSHLPKDIASGSKNVRSRSPFAAHDPVSDDEHRSTTPTGPSKLRSALKKSPSQSPSRSIIEKETNPVGKGGNTQFRERILKDFLSGKAEVALGESMHNISTSSMAVNTSSSSASPTRRSPKSKSGGTILKTRSFFSDLPFFRSHSDHTKPTAKHPEAFPTQPVVSSSDPNSTTDESASGPHRAVSPKRTPPPSRRAAQDKQLSSPISSMEQPVKTSVKAAVPPAPSSSSRALVSTSVDVIDAARNDSDASNASKSSVSFRTAALTGMASSAPSDLPISVQNEASLLGAVATTTGHVHSAQHEPPPPPPPSSAESTPPTPGRTAVTSPSRYAAKRIHNGPGGVGSPISVLTGGLLTGNTVLQVAQMHNKDMYTKAPVVASVPDGAGGLTNEENQAITPVDSIVKVKSSMRQTITAKLSSPKPPSSSKQVESTTSSVVSTAPAAAPSFPIILPPTLPVQYQQSSALLSVLSRNDLKLKLLTLPQLLTMRGGVHITSPHNPSAVMAAATIIAELLESQYYLELYCVDEGSPNVFEEYLFIPIQCVMGIDIDQRQSGLFRLTLMTNDSSYPLIYSHTQNSSSNAAPNQRRNLMALANGHLNHMNKRIGQASTAECVLKASLGSNSMMVSVENWLQVVVDINSTL